MTEVTCDGRCCAVFPLSIDIRDLIKGERRFTDRDYILSMLVPLSPKGAKERWKALGFNGDVPKPMHRGQLWTCRHWDEKTRLCAAYEDRPALCRDYPYGSHCNMADCSYQVPDHVRGAVGDRRVRGRTAQRTAHATA